MSTRQKFMNAKVGTYTLASMLAALVCLALVFATSDATALTPSIVPEPNIYSLSEQPAVVTDPVQKSLGEIGPGLPSAVRIGSDGRTGALDPFQNVTASGMITTFAFETPPTHRSIDGASPTHTEYVAFMKSGTGVFVYTRNLDGNLTDPN